MGVNLQSYRAAIGLFAASFVITTTSNILNFIFSILIINLLLLISGNVHPNPGPKQHSLILAHLNACSLASQINLVKYQLWYHFINLMFLGCLKLG